MLALANSLNWYAGWSLILAGFLSGAGLGIFFHHEDFAGGYTSFRRRMFRLGHIALVALGAINLLFAVAVPPTGGMRYGASVLLVVGAVAMPGICFLTGWRTAFRHTFFVPVLCLISAVMIILCGGPP